MEHFTIVQRRQPNDAEMTAAKHLRTHPLQPICTQLFIAIPTSTGFEVTNIKLIPSGSAIIKCRASGKTKK
jgi:hypothetical protein